MSVMAALRQLDDRVERLELEREHIQHSLRQLEADFHALRADVHSVRGELRQFRHLGWSLLVAVLIAPALAHWVQVVLGL